MKIKNCDFSGRSNKICGKFNKLAEDDTDDSKSRCSTTCDFLSSVDRSTYGCSQSLTSRSPECAWHYKQRHYRLEDHMRDFVTNVSPSSESLRDKRTALGDGWYKITRNSHMYAE